MTFGRLLLAFILIPVIELLLLIRIGGAIGALPTVGLVVLTGLLGAVLVRAQGMRALARFRSGLAGGELPEQAALDGICVLAGGALLLFPGVLTDVLGVALLFPPTRRWILRRMRRRLERGLERGTIRVVTSPHGFGFGAASDLRWSHPPDAAAGRGPRLHGSGRHPGRGGTPERGDTLDRGDTPDLDPRHGIEVPLNDD